MVRLGCDLDDLFSYSTERVVRIRDRRLGIAQVAITVAVFFYIGIYEAILNEGYLEKEEPAGFVVSSLRRGYEGSDYAYPDYCSPRHYPYDQKLPCLYIDEGQALFPESESSAMFITTRLKVTLARRQSSCGTAVYEKAADGTRTLTGLVRTPDSLEEFECPDAPPTYETSNEEDSGGSEFLVGDVENFTVMWRHGVYGARTGRLEYVSALEDAILDPLAGGSFSFLPRTDDIGGGLAANGYVGTPEGDIMTIQKILSGTSDPGVWSLDQEKVGVYEHVNCTAGMNAEHQTCANGCYWVGPWCDFDGKTACAADPRCTWEAESGDAGECQSDASKVSGDWCQPVTERYDGVVLMVLIEYETVPWDLSALRYKYRVVRIPKAEFKVIQRFEHDDHVAFHSRYGIRILFQVTGHVSRFSMVSLLKTLVSGMALLAVAKVIIESVLMKVLPLQEVYHNFKYTTTVDFSHVDLAKNGTGGLTARDFAYGINLPADAKEVQDLEHRNTSFYSAEERRQSSAKVESVGACEDAPAKTNPVTAPPEMDPLFGEPLPGTTGAV